MNRAYVNRRVDESSQNLKLLVIPLDDLLVEKKGNNREGIETFSY